MACDSSWPIFCKIGKYSPWLLHWITSLCLQNLLHLTCKPVSYVTFIPLLLLFLFHIILLLPFNKTKFTFSSSATCSIESNSATLWTVALQAPLSMQFSRQEYRSGLPFPPPADLPNSEIKPASPVSPALAGGLLTCWAIAEAPYSLSPKIFLHISASRRDSLNFMPRYLPCNLDPIFHKLLLVFESFSELFLYFMDSLKGLVHQTSLRELTGVNIWLRNFKV